MDTRSEIREFLTSRRAKITPEQAGLTAYGPRRVPGLRREEVAVLAGVSVPYYTRLQRGTLSGVSDGVLDAIAKALQLDDAERLHLFDLARAAQPTVTARPRRPAKQQVRPSVQHILDAITGAAAFVRNDRLDILAPTPSAPRSTASCSPARAAPRMPPGSSSSTPAAATSTPPGTRPPTTPSPCCAPRPGTPPTTAASQTSSAAAEMVWVPLPDERSTQIGERRGYYPPFRPGAIAAVMSRT